MGHIISNPFAEKDMTIKFICVLYLKDRNNEINPHLRFT